MVDKECGFHPAYMHLERPLEINKAMMFRAWYSYPKSIDVNNENDNGNDNGYTSLSCDT